RRRARESSRGAGMVLSGSRELFLHAPGIGGGLCCSGGGLRLHNRFDPANPVPPSVPLFMLPAEHPAELVRALGWWLLGAAVWLFCNDRLSDVLGVGLRRAMIVTIPAIVYATLFVATRNTEPLPVTHP